MPRKPRPLLAGGTYHVTARGNNREAIFHDDRDRLLYLQLLAWGAIVTSARMIAYVLMTNHVHLIVQTSAPNLDKTIHRIHRPYAAQFNRRYDRVGHVFASRYHSALIIEDSYLLEATRYVHLNPVRAGVAPRPEDFPWSSYRWYLQPQRADGLVDPRPVLALLGDDVEGNGVAYERFVRS